MSAALLTVAEVMARYGLRDRRAARRVMDDAGAFELAGKLYLRSADLLAHEEALIAARKGTALPDLSNDPTRPPARPRARKERMVRQPLGPGWWRQDPTAGRLAPPTNSGG